MMKTIWMTVAGLLICSAVHAAAAEDRPDFDASSGNYSCMQLAALNEILLIGARDMQSGEQDWNVRHVYIGTSSADQKPSLKAALLEQASAVYRLFLDKHCLSD